MKLQLLRGTRIKPILVIPDMAFFLAVLFLYTGLSKVLDPGRFISQLQAQILPAGFVPVLAIAVPGIELVLAGLLFIPKARNFAFWGATILLLLFSLYVALVLLNAFKRTPCGCAFGFEHLSWPAHLLLNLCFLGGAIAGLLTENEHR